jgi:D-sedoheptulose 7-phosphate isomerase
MSDSVRAAIAASIAAKEALLADEEAVAAVARAAATVSASLAGGGKVWLFGNGGSAADAQHIAAELVGRFGPDRRALPAEALTTNSSILTAVANDYGFDEIFARQLEASARPGDVAIGISTSGASENVLRGLRKARELGLETVALTGGNGGALRDAAAECIVVPDSETPRIQECHLLIGHVLCQLVEAAL